VHSVNENSYLKPVLTHATVFNRGDNRIAMANVVRPEAIDLGRSIEQGTKGMSFVELWRLYHDLSLLQDVRTMRDDLLDSLVAVDAWSYVHSTVAAHAPVILRGTGEAERTEYHITAARLEGADLLPAPNGALLIRIYMRGVEPGVVPQLRSEITAPRATLTLAQAQADGTMRFDLLVEDATVRDPRVGGRGVQRGLHLAELDLVGSPRVDRAEVPSDELTRLARETAANVEVGPPRTLAALLLHNEQRFAEKLGDVRNDIIARFAQRTSQAMTAMLMLLTGSVLAVLVRNRTPLFVYLLAFLPAIVDILLISGGEQMLKRSTSIAGLCIAFGGNAALIGVCLYAALRVRKH
jgi:hypothetical protein